jgi:hypothetical protein
MTELFDGKVLFSQEFRIFGKKALPFLLSSAETGK